MSSIDRGSDVDTMQDVSPIGVELNCDERNLLLAGLRELGGSAAHLAWLAKATGYETLSSFEEECGRLLESIADYSVLNRSDWAKVLMINELLFISDIVGVGVEWETVTGLGDNESLHILRALQRKLADVIDTSFLRV